MKKRVNTLLGVGALIGLQLVTNKIIFKKSDLSKKISLSETLFYRHKFGKIKYTVYENGKPPILLIHGICIGASSLEFESVVNYLSKKFQVYTLDLLGFGLSDRPNISYSSYMYVEIINSFIKEIIGKATHVIASNTSADFIVMASSFHPSNFEKIILVNPTGIKNNDLYRGFKNKAVKNILDAPIIGTSIYNMISSRFFIGYYLRKFVFGKTTKVDASSINKYYYAAHYKSEKNKYPISRFLSSFLNVDITEALKNTKSEILVIFGEDNPYENVYLKREVAKGNTNVSFEVIPFTKLLPHVDRPDLFLKSIVKFIKSK